MENAFIQFFDFAFFVDREALKNEVSPNSSNQKALMASNRVIFCVSFLYSFFLATTSNFHLPSSIFILIRSITHLATDEETLKHYSYSLISSNVIKFAFLYSIASVFLSTAMTFAFSSSLRNLTTAITRHWKPFVASLAAAVIFPVVIRPPSMETLYGTYFVLTLFHALFVVYVSVKLVTMPMLEEKYGKDMEIPKNVSWRFLYWQIMTLILQTGTSYLSKEAYGIQVLCGVINEVRQMVWIAGFYEPMAFIVLMINNRNKKKLAEAKETLSTSDLV